MSHPNSLPRGLSSTDEVRISPELAKTCYRAGRTIFHAFILWVELRSLDRAFTGRGHRSGQLPYLEAQDWLCARGWDEIRIVDLVRGVETFFQEVWRWPKPPLLRLTSFERVCRHFNVVPVSGWRQVPLAEFTNGRRHSAVRAVMALPANDAPPWVKDKPLPRGTIRANTGISERTQLRDEIRLGIERGKRKNWRFNDSDDWARYPLHQIGNSYKGFGLSGPVGRVLHVQVAMLGTRCLFKGAQQLLRQPWPRRYYKTAKSLHQALRKQDSQEGKGIPTGLQHLIIPQQVDADPLFQVPRADRLRSRAREWRCLSV